MSFLFAVIALSALYAGVARLERRPALRFRPLPSPRPYLLTDVAWYGVTVAATAVFVFVFRPQLAALAVPGVAGAVRVLPAALQLLFALLLFDLVSFALHVGLHRSDLLWNIHKVHHSSRQLDGFATTRAHLLENVLRFVPAQAALLVVGLTPAMITVTVAIAAAYGIFNHSNVGADLSRVEAVLVTPRMHRRHHIPSTTRHNFGTMFTVWDRLFGTRLRRDTESDEVFGVPGEVDTYPQHFRAAVRRPFVDMRARLTRGSG